MRVYFLLILLLFLTACGTAAPAEPEGNSEPAAEEVVAEATEEVVEEAAPTEAPTEVPPTDTPEPVAEEEGDTEADTESQAVQGDEEIITTESGLQYVIIEEGTGERPEPGAIVQVHYTGTLEDGTKFDSSLDRGQPFEFPLGWRQVIAGWDEGIALMREGGKARFIIPSELGYGSRGSGAVIPPDATLIFEVELLSFTPGPPPPPPPPKAPTEVAEEDYTTTDSGLMYHDFEVGDGPSPEAGQTVSVHYTGWLEDGTMFDSSLLRGEPINFPVGQGNVIPGWDEGVLSMSVGGKRQLVIPSELAYGERGAGQGAIPPNATLIFEVELVDVLPAPPEAPTEVAEADYTTTDSGLMYHDFEVGDGPSPEAGQTVSVHYTGWLEDGTMFDSSFLRGQPIDFPIGVGGVIPGWDEGVLSMNVGGKRQLVIPADLGYGAQGAGNVIPPNATLIFEVELVGVK